MAIVYITHKMDEVFAIADTVTVLRDGRHVATRPAAELDADTLIRLMVGRDLGEVFPKPCAAGKEVALSVRGLTRAGAFRNISFDLYRGEVLGLAGLIGAGRTEVASAIFGLAPADAGEILVQGRPAEIRRPADAMRLRNRHGDRGPQGAGDRPGDEREAQPHAGRPGGLLPGSASSAAGRNRPSPRRISAPWRSAQRAATRRSAN